MAKLKDDGIKGATRDYEEIINNGEIIVTDNDEEEKPTWEDNDNDIFWDLHPMLTYDALYNWIVGNRGGGKTYGAKKFCIDRFIKNEEQFVYVRRYKTELKRIHTFFDDIAEKYPDHELKVDKSGEFYIDGQRAGASIPLSTAKIEKSVPFPKVKTIIFDEFIIDKGVYHYLPDEVTAFLEMYETIARMRDVRVIFLSNALSVTNPYFLYFNLQLPYKKNIWYKDDKLVELVAKESFIEKKKNTRFGKMVKDTPYGRYSIDNEFLRDNKTFVEKKTGQCTFLCALVYNGITYGIWLSYSQGKVWMSKDYEKDTPYIYALTREDQTPNVMLFKSLKYSRSFTMFKNAAYEGYLYYENINIKNIGQEILGLVARY